MRTAWARRVSLMGVWAALAFTHGAFAAEPAAVQVTIPHLAEPSPLDPWVDLAKALAWPLAVAILAAVFRKPLVDLASAIGGRVNKVQFAQLSIELATARPAPTRAPLVEAIKDPTRQAQTGDSSNHLLEQARLIEPADFALIRLGEGDEWLTSRLFIAAAAGVKSPIWRHSTMKWAQAAWIVGPLSFRKLAMVLWSGASLPVSHISSTLRCASRSSRRLDCTGFS